jgi:hypothetical protein
MEQFSEDIGEQVINELRKFIMLLEEKIKIYKEKIAFLEEKCKQIE